MPKKLKKKINFFFRELPSGAPQGSELVVNGRVVEETQSTRLRANH